MSAMLVDSEKLVTTINAKGFSKVSKKDIMEKYPDCVDGDKINIANMLALLIKGYRK